MTGQPGYTCTVDGSATRHQSVGNQLGDAPVFERPVWKVSSDNEGDFSLSQLLDSDLERVCLAVKRNKDGGVHAVASEKILEAGSRVSVPDLQSPCTEDTSPFVLGQVSRGYADLVGLAFALWLRGCSCGWTVCHLLVTPGITIGSSELVGFLLAIQTSLFGVLVVFCQEVVSVVLFFRK